MCHPPPRRDMNGWHMELGFLGLGQMGAAIAERLEADDVRLHVFDPNPVAVEIEIGAIADPTSTVALPEVAAKLGFSSTVRVKTCVAGVRPTVSKVMSPLSVDVVRVRR